MKVACPLIFPRYKNELTKYSIVYMVFLTRLRTSFRQFNTFFYILDLPIERTCHLHEFQCGTKTCIPANRVCDIQRDCIGGEDENHTLCCKSRFVKTDSLSRTNPSKGAKCLSLYILLLMRFLECFKL